MGPQPSPQHHSVLPIVEALRRPAGYLSSISLVSRAIWARTPSRLGFTQSAAKRFEGEVRVVQPQVGVAHAGRGSEVVGLISKPRDNRESHRHTFRGQNRRWRVGSRSRPPGSFEQLVGALDGLVVMLRELSRAMIVSCWRSASSAARCQTLRMPFSAAAARCGPHPTAPGP